MSDAPERPSHRRLWLFAIWLGVAFLTLCLAIWGWYLQSEVFNATGARKIENALYLSLRVFSLNDLYVSPTDTGGRWQLVLARWLGAVIFLSGLVTASLSLFRAQLATLAASRRRRFILIIGDHDMAFALARHAREAGVAAVHVTTSAVTARHDGSLISLPRAPGDDGLATGRANRAARVIIAEADIGESLENGLRAAKRLKALAGSVAPLAVHLDNPWLAERIHYAVDDVELFTFSETHAAARSVTVRHPPFLLARRMGAQAIHVLIIGFDSLGQELARDIVMNGLGVGLGRPRITVVESDPVAGRRDFLHWLPEFPHLCDLEVFRDLDEARLGLSASEETPEPICAAYVCHHDSAEALAAAIALRESAVRHDILHGPIFVRLRAGGLERPAGGIAVLQALGLYGFGGLAESAVACRALHRDPDATAKAVHESYARIGGDGAVPWAHLDEEMRVSNRRAASHIPAKLATLGFDLEPWLAMPDEDRPWPPPVAPDVILLRDAEERTRMAMLEHERWVIDRRLNGWRQGPARDNARKVHTDLKPFDELPEAVRAYDYQVAEWLESFLPRKPGGLERRPEDQSSR